MVASLPPSFSESSSDSAELDSSSVCSLFPNRTLSGLGERSNEQSLVVSLDSIGSSGKVSVFFLRSFHLSCQRAYEGLLFPCEGPDFSLFSENTKEFLESSIVTCQLLCGPGACASSAACQQLCLLLMVVKMMVRMRT